MFFVLGSLLLVLGSELLVFTSPRPSPQGEGPCPHMVTLPLI